MKHFYNINMKIIDLIILNKNIEKYKCINEKLFKTNNIIIDLIKTL